MSVLSLGRAVRGSVVAVAAAVSIVGAVPAFADPPATINSASVNLQGGSARSLAACLNLAQVSARHQVPAQSNFCRNVAVASGGTVQLTNVNAFIDQEGTGPGRTVNHARINLTGGDATAVAACVNYLQGTASADQTNICSNNAQATGGNVELRNVDVTLVQSGQTDQPGQTGI